MIYPEIESAGMTKVMTLWMNRRRYASTYVEQRRGR